MTSAKANVISLFEVLKSKGVNEIVFSPGSRNAPLIIAANEDRFFTTYNIPDERVAGFFALGLSMRHTRPAVICCTSGSACLNYAPAIAEAYYQQISMIIVTADRPVEWVDQGDGQTLQQNQVFAPFIKGSFSLLQEATHKDEIWYNDRNVNELTNLSMTLPFGPVHLNLPLREPLYERNNSITSPKDIRKYSGVGELCDAEWSEIFTDWSHHEKVILLCGQMKQNHRLEQLINEFSQCQDVVIMTETTSNVTIVNSINCIDRTIESISELELNSFQPTLLVTIGGAVVSKKVKAFFRTMANGQHWHISASEPFHDTYQHLVKAVETSPEVFFSRLIKSAVVPIRKTFKKKWLEVSTQKRAKHLDFLKIVEWSDLVVFDQILKSLPPASSLHFANSTPIRYSQLFDLESDIQCFCNRGLSGIDGSTSTAVGYANGSTEMTTLITGDMAFMYDSNAFYHQHIPSNLKVIVINNGGGGIFRVIPGPDSTNQLVDHFESNQNVDLKYIALAHGVQYFHADDINTLQTGLKNIYSDEMGAAILEIFTPRFRNSGVLKNYFAYLKIENKTI